MRALIRTLRPIVLVISLAAAVPAAGQQSAALFPGDTQCPPGQRLLSLSAALTDTPLICNKLQNFEIARLSGLGSISGPGLNCRISKQDIRPLYQSLCVAEQDYSQIRGVLLNGQFRSQEMLNAMSQEDWRMALVTELANRTAASSVDYQQMTHDALAGAGGIMDYLLRIRQLPPNQLARMQLDEMRQVLIRDLVVQTGRSRRELQHLSDLELLNILNTG